MNFLRRNSEYDPNQIDNRERRYFPAWVTVTLHTTKKALLSTILPAIGLSSCNTQKNSAERKEGQTHWIQLGTVTPELKQKIERGERVAVLIGGPHCQPCEAAKKWWQTKDMGEFEAYYIGGDPQTTNYQGILNGYTAGRVPVLIFFDGNQKSPFFHGYYGCTDASSADDGRKPKNIATQWLNQNGY